LNELQQQLQAALGNTCRLERELGGGGMSRVFVATETALNRSADRGDRAKAAEYYQKYIDLRREADPSLQPQVAEVKQKLAEVAGEKK
jgi:hypothetical protein